MLLISACTHCGSRTQYLSRPGLFIAGCSTGPGRALATLIVKRGWQAIVTAHDVSSIADIVRDAEDHAVALKLDVTKQADIDAAVATARKKFGRIDVLVNNAGYGYQSTAEEGVEAEIREQFDANVFGLFALTRAVLPIMRAQRSGNIINVSSVAGLIGFRVPATMRPPRTRLKVGRTRCVPNWSRSALSWADRWPRIQN